MANNYMYRTGNKGAPIWMITFGDMMALLLTFFILLFSFSSLDANKYKQVSDAIEDAFGKKAKQTLETLTQKVDESSVMPAQTSVMPEQESVLQQLKSLLATEIEQGMLDVEMADKQTIIRFPERIAFPTGSEELTKNFGPMLDKVITIITKSEGSIVVAGHTDDRPINNERFRSNWDLSSARAVSVIHAILARSKIDPTRLVAQGYADTHPLATNTSEKNRANNRRVEILIMEATKLPPQQSKPTLQ